jgi:pimeloyl-ACP methyl ester carboxylesterase/DNA-binding CsgD family transcriptional regulator
MRRNFQEIDELVDRVYDIAVAPERMDQLIDSWTARLDGADSPRDFEVLVEPGILEHVQRAERVLRELIAVSSQQNGSARDWTEASRAASLVVNRSGVVIAASVTAQRLLEIELGNTLGVLPAIPEDVAHLVGIIESLGTATESETRLLRLRRQGDGSPILIRIVEGVGGNPEQIGLLTSILAWPARLSDRLASTFGLTQAEGEVLKDLTLGHSVSEVAERSGRLESTIRSHVRALLGKCGTRSQLELVRLVLGLLDVAGEEPLIAPLRGPPGISPESNHYNTLNLADGRRLDYLVIGDPRGRPFLMLPTDMGFTRLPPKAESWLGESHMRMVVPVRAGYGRSSPLPRRRDAFAVAIEDMQALCDHLGMARTPVLAFCDDFHLAVAFACAKPRRVTAIIGVGPTMPATEMKHFRRMPRWTRFIYANARYAPRAVPYVTMAFFQAIRRLGPKRFLQTVMASAPADLKVLEDDEVLTAMLRGTEISVGPRFTAHAAWAAGALSNYAVDWSARLASCPAPMILFAGDQDPFAPIETTREFAAMLPRVTLHELAGHGQLLYPVWPRFLGEVRRHLAD